MSVPSHDPPLLITHDLLPRCSPLSFRRAALELWKQKRGSDATYNNLIKVFETAGYKDLAEFVKRITGKFYW